VDKIFLVPVLNDLDLYSDLLSSKSIGVLLYSSTTHITLTI
jgi:hypothetical protein